MYTYEVLTTNIFGESSFCIFEGCVLSITKCFAIAFLSCYAPSIFLI